MSWSTPKVTWQATEFYNTEDWDRVRNNLIYCNQWFIDHNYPSVQLNPLVLDRGRAELPTPILVNKLEDNLKMLYDIFGVPFTEWQPREYWYGRLEGLYSRNPNYTDWNRWEQLPKRIKESLDYIETYFWHRVSGTFKCGNYNRIVQLLSRGR